MFHQLTAAIWRVTIRIEPINPARRYLQISSQRMDGVFAQLGEQRPLVGVVQMTSTENKDDNFDVGRSLIEKAHRRGAKMVFLPEAFDFIGTSREFSMAAAERLDGQTITRYGELARRYGVWLSLGGFHQQSSNPDDDRLLNTHVLLDASGHVISSYSKVHLFDVDIPGRVRLVESDYTAPGQHIVAPVSTPVGHVGMAICYDLRFPEMSIALTQQGADILTYPSAFTVETGMAHWKTLLRSRAIENQCYVIAAAQVGSHNTRRRSYGHTMVVDPWGCVIAENADQVDVIMAEINIDLLKEKRHQMPVYSHRRYDLYGHVQTTSKCSIDSQEVYEFGKVQVKSKVVFFRSALSYAIVNRKPVLPGHILVCPLRRVARLSELTTAEVADLFTSCQTIAKVIEEKYGSNSLTISVQDGPEAGQTVQHVHVHILPRKNGDFSKNDDVYDKLEHHDRQESGEIYWRTEDDMSAEAATLRPYFI